MDPDQQLRNVSRFYNRRWLHWAYLQMLHMMVSLSDRVSYS